MMTLALTFAVLVTLAACWFGLHYWANPPLKDPDAQARITGNCGDTMELALGFCGGRVARVRHWTDGCSVSNQCIEAVAMLARGKGVDGLRKINMIHIMECTGHLPESHLHCAQLAETTLQHAIVDYIRRQKGTTCHLGPEC